jgi:hypothetical protein
MSPTTGPAVHEEPALAAQVQVAEVISDGKTSLTVAPTASDGPAFATVIV